MTSISGLSQYPYNNAYTGVGGLAQFLNNTSSSGSGTGYQPTNLLGAISQSNGGSSADTSLLGSSGGPSYDFPQDSLGRPVVATQSDMDAVAKPGDKLTIASQIAEAIRMQSDCSVQGGCAGRIGDMTSQTKTLLDSVNSVVSGLASADGSSAPGTADQGVTPYQSSISKVLGRIASVMANLQVLTSKATPDVASKTSTALTALSTEAGTIASQAGLDWATMSKAGMTALTSGTTSISMPRLIDFLA